MKRAVVLGALVACSSFAGAANVSAQIKAARAEISSNSVVRVPRGGVCRYYNAWYADNCTESERDAILERNIAAHRRWIALTPKAPGAAQADLGDVYAIVGRWKEAKPELAAAIASIRDIFPGRKLTAVFQPHLYTRTRDFAPEFAEALSAVDKLILLDIYPARELPIEGVTSEIIFNRVTAPEKVLLRKEELMDHLAKEPLDVLATFGAGNVDRYIQPITDLLQSRL